MNNELKELLRSVLKEELEPMNKRLDVIEKDVKEIKTGQEQLQKNIIESLGQSLRESLITLTIKQQH
ncbi:hypothetical protein [Bacillus sp. V3B]|uniref:hypothetical protein n=1 Tax=Bacillus sp. V3B TaxID=2804915 RepID=UPI00210BA998|nr:hypothetical protein [Bacillus sp. V3B]